MCMRGKDCSQVHAHVHEEMSLRVRQSKLRLAIVERFPELMGSVGLGLRSKSFLE